MLPAQIPLTLEHLFPTPSNSNVRTARRSFFLFLLRVLNADHAQQRIIAYRFSIHLNR
jgi:hypothetical protein